MHRILGAGMILGGCLGLGLWYREQFRGRLRTLRELAGMLELFMGEIRFGKATLPECCMHIAGRMQDPYRSCLQDIYASMQKNTGREFGQVYREHMECCLAGLPLTKEDKTLLEELFTRNGFEEGGMQIRIIEQSRDELKRSILELEAVTAQKGRMAVGLGGMSGLLLLIILL